MTRSIWSDDERAVLWLRKLYGTKSAKEIAATLSEEFGVTISRNAVIGKLGRLGLTRENTQQADRVTRGPRALRKPRAPRPARNPVFRIINAGVGAMRVIETLTGEVPASVDTLPRGSLTLHQMDDDKCHYIAGEDHLYCGNRVVAGLPYCAGHCRLMYAPPKPRLPPKYRRTA